MTSTAATVTNAEATPPPSPGVQMDAEDRAELVEAITDQLADSIGITTQHDRELTAGCIIERIEWKLAQMGWRPPADWQQLRDWAAKTRSIPDHHINRDVLNAHLAELYNLLSANR